MALTIAGADLTLRNETTGAQDFAPSLNPGDGLAATSKPAIVSTAIQHRFNGTTYDRERGNVETGALVVPTTSSVNGADQTNHNGRGITVVVDITALTGTSITFTIQGKDPTSGKYYTLLVSAALVGTGTTILRVGPGLTAAANTVANDQLPRTFRVITTAVALSALTATVAGTIHV